jgi:uncharacterized protein involved in response to NO
VLGKLLVPIGVGEVTGASTTAERARSWKGPAVLGYGFRPMFLAAAVWAALAMALWIAALTGRLQLPTALAPVDWHAHAMLYGFVPAVVAGFLLTAVPNWTGRLPVVGWPLLALVAVWLAGRVAVTASGWLAPGLAAAVDLGFLALLAGVIGREVVAGRNWRNLPVLAAVGLLWVGNLAFHLDAGGGAAAQGWGARLGVAVPVFLIVLIGGRIVPSFTRNWLAKRGPGRLPTPADRFDVAAVALAALALALWAARPEARASAAACLAAAAMHAARLGRWAGWRTVGEPLVAILHVGYLFVLLGFLLVGPAGLAPGVIAPGAALHAWTAGAVGVMTLAVMTRASLGHTGRALTADGRTRAIYGAVVASALLRVASGLAPGQAALLHLSAGLWIAAFAGFAAAYFGVLTGPRIAPKAPTRP